MDTTIPCRARSSINIARRSKSLGQRISFATYRGDNPNVRVVKVHTYTVELQIRTGEHYANATLSKDEAQALAVALIDGAEHIKAPALRERAIIGEPARDNENS